jgi:hypothetical protein
MLPILVAIALAGQDKPTVDRSAAPGLKQLFENAATVSDVYVVVDSFSRSTGDWYSPAGTSDIYLGRKGQFRYQSTSNRGGSSLLVCDGATLMADPLSDDETIVLKKATQPFYEVAPRELLAFMVAGPTGYDKTIDTDADIKFTTAPAGQKAIEFRSKGLGKVVVVYVEGSALPSRIDLYRSQRRSEDGQEQSVPATMQYVRVLAHGNLPKYVFVAEPPKGQKVDDQRGIAKG